MSAGVDPKLASQAARAARGRLIAAHLDEYEGYRREEREARGLPPASGSGAVQALLEQNAELKRQLELLAGTS